MQFTQKEWIGFGLAATGLMSGVISAGAIVWSKSAPEIIAAVTAAASVGLSTLASVWAAYNHITSTPAK
jgi:hypothetical protein